MTALHSFDPELHETLGERIGRLRRRLGLHQADLAKTVGVARSSVAAWESGRHEPTKRNLARVARTLGVTKEYLVMGDAGHAARLGEAAKAALEQLAESS